jgi:hypothetical protein
MRESEEKTRNALKYLVRWEVVNITQPRRNISNEDRLPEKFCIIASVEQRRLDPRAQADGWIDTDD